MAIEDYTENYAGLAWSCPHCGQLNSPDEWTCWSCNLAPEMCRDCRRLDCQCDRFDKEPKNEE